MYSWCERVRTCHIRHARGHAGLFSIRRLCARLVVLACCVISSLVITNAVLSNSPLICCVCIALRVSSRPRYMCPSPGQLKERVTRLTVFAFLVQHGC